MRKLLGPLVLVVLAAGCGSGDSGMPATPTGSGANRSPITPAIGIFPSGVMLFGVTNATFSAQTTDPDGDALSYTWAFGDGGTATGAVVSHVFGTTINTHTVSVSISDGKGGATTASTFVVVKTIQGTWTDADPFYGLRFNQIGATCNGNVFAQGGWGAVSSIENCVLSHPRNISFFRRTFYPGVFAQCQYSGNLDESVDRMSVRCDSATVFTLKRD